MKHLSVLQYKILWSYCGAWNMGVDFLFGCKTNCVCLVGEEVIFWKSFKVWSCRWCVQSEVTSNGQLPWGYESTTVLWSWLCGSSSLWLKVLLRWVWTQIGKQVCSLRLFRNEVSSRLGSRFQSSTVGCSFRRLSGLPVTKTTPDAILHCRIFYFGFMLTVKLWELVYISVSLISTCIISMYNVIE